MQKTTTVDEELVSKVLSELDGPVGPFNGGTAFDFAKLLLETILRPEDKPIVFINKKWPIIGKDARAMLRDKPDELQDTAQCTAKNGFRNPLRPNDGSNRGRNLRQDLSGRGVRSYAA